MDLNDFGKNDIYKEGLKAQEEERKEGDDVTEQGENPGCTRNTRNYVFEFCGRTSIHGLSYLGERGRSLAERIWWLIIILVALYLCVSQIIQTYQKWMNSPVIVTFATTQTPIWEIPFPAVTVCSEIKTRKSRFNYTDIYLKKENKRELTENEEKEFEYMSLVCGSNSKLLNENLTTTDENAMKFLSEVAPDFGEMMFDVKWRGHSYKGDKLKDLFSPILTSEGICYTFNLMDRSEIFTTIVPHYADFFSTNGKHSQWSMESGYTDDASIDAFPRRTVVAGVKGGLGMTFYAPHGDLDYACGDSLQGFKITLHHPAEIPRVKQKYFRVPLDQSVVASIKPNMMATAGELENYTPEDRQCYFTRERSLKLFNIYNQQNCLIECLTDYTINTCGCVGFHMARNNSTAICGAIKKDCLEEAKASFLASEVSDKIEHSKNPKPVAKEKTASASEQCNCLPSCNSLDFDVETSQSDWEWREYLEIERQTMSWNSAHDSRQLQGSHFSRVALYFKEMQFITSERNELYGQTDFWANCGGLLGLFSGFSFISFFEILYYLTLRVACNVRKFGRHYWSGSEELLNYKEKSEDSKSA